MSVAAQQDGVLPSNQKLHKCRNGGGLASARRSEEEGIVTSTQDGRDGSPLTLVEGGATWGSGRMRGEGVRG